MQREYLPDSAQYVVKEVSEVSRNAFKLETVSSDQAGPNRIITFNLPENAIVDMKSLKFFADVACVGAGAGVDQVFAKLPQHASSLIAGLEVYINGQQVQNRASEYFTIAQAERLAKSNIDKDNSTDRALSHSYITGDDADDDETVCISEWCGFLNDASTRYVNTGVLGQIQIRLSLAGNFALVPKQTGVDLGLPISAGAATNAQQITFAMSKMYFCVDTVSLSPMYNEALRSRLMNGGLELNYREFYSFQLDGIQAGNSVGSSTRFSLSSGCINRLTGIYRDSSYTEIKRSSALPNANGVSAYTSNALRFRSYAGSGVAGAPATKKSANTTWKYLVNNVSYPQFSASWMDMLSGVAYGVDKVGPDNSGSLITSKESYNLGKFLAPLLLEMPTGWGVACMSGYNSRGINTQMVLQTAAQLIPLNGQPTATGGADGDLNSGSVSCMVIADTTAKLVIESGRSLAVQF